MALFAYVAWSRDELQFARFMGAASMGLVLIYLGLEVRHWFHGTRLDNGLVYDGELYAYSLVGLVYAGALLAAGFRTGSQVLRHAGLVMLLLTVGKVFLVDMSELKGLFRVMSFLGLGLVLVGIGYAYQRFFTKGAPPSAPAATGP
jgi:uncharacterized membrane protein